VEIRDIINEVTETAYKYNLQIIGIDRTDNIISLIILIDKELFIQIYGNTQKEKINFALIFKNRRLYGFDSEGGKYHCHPFDGPEVHVFVDERKSMREFVQESIRYLEEKEIL